MTSDSSALMVCNVFKSFEGAAALRDVSLTMRPGTIHALIGENGAGKSTLIKVMTGVHRPDRGRVVVNGADVSFHRPQDALSSGISVVHQERNFVPELSVAENIFLHTPPRRIGFLHYDRLFADAQPWLEMVGLPIDPRTPARELSVAQAQLLEVARALARQARILLLDEPTASLTDQDTASFFQLLRKLRDSGGAILFVSHRLREIFDLCDRVTVLRDGQTILDDADVRELTHDSVITAMVGREIARHRRHGAPVATAPAVSDQASVLELRGVSTAFGHSLVNLSISAGRIVGLYGLIGAGRTELAKAIIGLIPIDEGQLLFRQQPVTIRSPFDALHKYGIGYVSEDRKGEGLILDHSIGKNVGITIWQRLGRRLGLITPTMEDAAIGPVVNRMGVKFHRIEQAVYELSGGNQQKVSVAKWLASDVEVLIIDEPTIGVDVRTKEEMYQLVEALAVAGKAILVISSDLEEIVRIADTILVMADKQLVAELPNDGNYASLSSAIFQAILSAASAGTQAPVP